MGAASLFGFPLAAALLFLLFLSYVIRDFRRLANVLKPGSVKTVNTSALAFKQVCSLPLLSHLLIALYDDDTASRAFCCGVDGEHQLLPQVHQRVRHRRERQVPNC